MHITTYFNTSNTKYTLICINKNSGNCLSSNTEANIYTIPYLHWFSQSAPRDVNGTPGLAAVSR